jgi:acyl-CoA synthetase (AMP-forming)/AMP-acid ligase II
MTVAFGPASVIESVPGAVGVIQSGVTVEAIDKSGQVLAPLQDGVLRVRTNYMVSEYVGDPEATQTFFRDGYFYPGDIGHITPEGLLVITGREKTAINVGGDTISPERVENVIAAFPNVGEAGVFATENALGIVELSALIVTRSPVDESLLRDHCAGRLSPSCVPVKFITVEALPRGGQGKLERHRFMEVAATKARPAGDRPG